MINYYQIIYKKVIFSNYELTENLFDDYENDNFKNYKYCKYIGSNFNQKEDIPLNLIHIE